MHVFKECVHFSDCRRREFETVLVDKVLPKSWVSIIDHLILISVISVGKLLFFKIFIYFLVPGIFLNMF